MSNETTSGAAPSERARSSSGRKEGSRRDRGLINPAVSRPTSWWLATLRRRAAAMYEEPVADLKQKVEFSSAAEQRACIAFFNAAYRAEESGLQQAHRLAQRFERTDPELAECLVLYGNEEGWHRELLTEFLAHIGGEIRPMGRVTGTFYNTYDRAEHMESIMLTNLMFETIGATTYRLALGRVRQPAIRAMLTILTRDESFHVPLNVHFVREILRREPGLATKLRLRATYYSVFGALILSSWASRRVAADFDHISFRELSTAYVENLGRLFAQSPDLDLKPPRPLLRLFGLGDEAMRREGSLPITAEAAERAADRSRVQVSAL
ncbi:MAG: ferritin-like domain-containing protein [Polyangia bacterium]